MSRYGLNYDSIVTVTVQDCWGNFSWRNSGGYQVFEMQEPVDTLCTTRDMSSFDSTYSSTADCASDSIRQDLFVLLHQQPYAVQDSGIRPRNSD